LHSLCRAHKDLAVPRGVPVSAGSAFSDATDVASQVESAIWTWNAAASAAAPVWTNSDGKTAPATLVYDAVDDVLLLVGDVAVFQAAMRVTVTPVVSHLWSILCSRC
jgi:hypothetical protein